MKKKKKKTGHIQLDPPALLMGGLNPISHSCLRSDSCFCSVPGAGGKVLCSQVVLCCVAEKRIQQTLSSHVHCKWKGALCFAFTLKSWLPSSMHDRVLTLHFTQILSLNGGSRIHLKFGRSGFDPWVRTIPWRRERLPTPVLWSGEFHEHRSWQATVHGITKNWAQLSNFHWFP